MDSQRSHFFMQKSVAFQTKNADRSILPRNLCLHKSMDRETFLLQEFENQFYIYYAQGVICTLLWPASIQILIDFMTQISLF